MNYIDKLASLGIDGKRFEVPDLVAIPHAAGTIYATPEAANKLPKISHSANARENLLILHCPIDGNIYLHGSNNTLLIAGNRRKTSRFHLNFWAQKSIFTFGFDSTCNGLQAEMINNDSITIGDDCMLSSEILMRPNDMHAIWDETGNRSNLARPIQVRDHVWIGQRVSIVKGVEIGSGAVCALGAVVTRSVPAACAVGGNPAKIIRRNLAWTRTDSPRPEEKARALSYIGSEDT